MRKKHDEDAHEAAEAVAASPARPRLVDASLLEDDAALRPRSFDEYVGQRKVVDNLKVFVQAAQRRGEALDHVLFSGPPGIGKTTLAHLIAHALGVPLRACRGTTRRCARARSTSTSGSARWSTT